MNEIIIVSGLPRSGTSMMMKILEAGGLKLMTDNIRKADTDNPKGYFEFEKVKNLKNDNSWLVNCIGKVVKVISMLLYYLPPVYRYKIFFMERDLIEIIISQTKMLNRSGKLSKNDNAILIHKFEEHLQKVSDWIKKQKNIECIFLKYSDIIENPVTNIHKITQFLGEDLNNSLMSQVIDNSLYRNINYR